MSRRAPLLRTMNVAQLGPHLKGEKIGRGPHLSLIPPLPRGCIPYLPQKPTSDRRARCHSPPREGRSTTPPLPAAGGKASWVESRRELLLPPLPAASGGSIPEHFEHGPTRPAHEPYWTGVGRDLEACKFFFLPEPGLKCCF
jgi:hypothetical protein